MIAEAVNKHKSCFGWSFRLSYMSAASLWGHMSIRYLPRLGVQLLPVLDRMPAFFDSHAAQRMWDSEKMSDSVRRVSEKMSDSVRRVSEKMRSKCRVLLFKSCFADRVELSSPTSKSLSRGDFRKRHSPIALAINLWKPLYSHHRRPWLQSTTPCKLQC